MTPSVAAPEEVQEEVQRIVAALLARTSEVADAMVAAIQAEIAPYAHAGPGVVEDVRAHCNTHARLTFEVMRADRAPLRRELEFARAAAARRVRQGIPLDSLLQAFRVGHRTVWEAVIEEAASGPRGRDAAIALAGPVMQYIDIASTQVAEAYLKQEQRLLATADRERRDLLEQLLAGNAPAREERIAVTELDPEGDLVVAIARPDGTHARDAHALHHVADTLAAGAASGPVEPLVVVRQREVVGILPATASKSSDPAGALRGVGKTLMTRRGITLRAGLSTVCSGFGGIAHAYEEARQALRRTSARRPVVALTEMSPFEYLLTSADAGTRRAVADKGRALLERDRDGAASETLLAYVAADLSIKGAAQRLSVHPNTVRYRLRRLSEITGLDYRSFAGLMDLVTVIRAVRDDESGPLGAV